MDEAVFFKSAFELAGMIKRRELSASELVKLTFERIDSLNPKINAFCALRREAAIEEARHLDQKLAAREPVGPLAGLPLGVKDLEDVAGMATTFGSKPFRDNIAKEDSLEVSRLRAAGAIVVGKTNTPEFGFTAFTRNLLFGVTRNPWNLERTPGGSSGGSSAAIAAGMVPLATASDGGGSIRIPACYTGTFGLKPSHGLIPVAPTLGMSDWVDFSVVGPITRSVRDAALYLDAAVGYHPLDPDSLPHPGISYAAMLERKPKNLRIAFHPDFGHAVQKDVAREVAKAARVFEELGWQVEMLSDPVPEVGAEWGRLFATRSYALLHDLLKKHRDEFNRAFVEAIEGSREFTWDKVAAAQRKRAEFNRWVAGLFARFDLLLTPTLPTEAFAADGPPPSEIEGHRLSSPLEALVFTYPFNFTGHPAVSLPAGFTDSGMPCGLQLVAERHREDLLLQVSYAYEQARPWQERRPQL